MQRSTVHNQHAVPHCSATSLGVGLCTVPFSVLELSALPTSMRVAIAKLTEQELQQVQLMVDSPMCVKELSTAMQCSESLIKQRSTSIYRKFRILHGDKMCMRIQLIMLMRLPTAHPWRIAIMKRNGWIQ